MKDEKSAAVFIG